MWNLQERSKSTCDNPFLGGWDWDRSLKGCIHLALMSMHSFYTYGSAFSHILTLMHFRGSVCRSSSLDWKKDQNWTEPNCKRLDHWLQLHKFWKFLVASCEVCQKIKKPKKTGLDRLQPDFRLVMVGPYLRTFFPNCRPLNHKKRPRIGWDMAKNISICNSNVCPFRFGHISAKYQWNCLKLWSVYRKLIYIFMYVMDVR